MSPCAPPIHDLKSVYLSISQQLPAPCESEFRQKKNSDLIAKPGKYPTRQASVQFETSGAMNKL